MIVRLATMVPAGAPPTALADRLRRLEQAGLDAVWIGESYGCDSPTLLGYLAAATTRLQMGAGILNVYSRTPALIAMTAVGLDFVSDGRAALGLGASGPQVVEALHGVPFSQPVVRLAECIDLCRGSWQREPVIAGAPFSVPRRAPDGTARRPMRLLHAPIAGSVPIHVAGLGSRVVELAAASADGWLPFLFLPERAADVWGDALRRGKARRDQALGPIDIMAGGPVAIVDDPHEAARRRDLVRPHLALYLGGMGQKGANAYNDLAIRYGYEAEALEVQDHYLSGRRREAEAAVPGSLIEATSLIGPWGWIVERVAAFREAGVTTLCLEFDDVDLAHEQVSTVERLRELVDREAT